MRCVHVGLVALVVGCHSVEVLAPPPVDGAGTVMLSAATPFADPLTRETPQLSVWVLAPEATPYPEIEYRDALELGVVAFACTPRQLGLKTGMQAIAPIRTGPKLPPSIARLRSRVSGVNQSPWGGVSKDPLLDASLARVEQASERLCEIYASPIKPIEVPLLPSTRSSSVVVMGVSLGTRTALLALASGELFRFDGQTAVQLDIPPTTPHHAGLCDASGEVWLFGNDGRVARGHPDRGFSELSVRGFGNAHEHVRVDGARGDAPFEIFVATDARSLERFDGERFTCLSTSAPGRDETTRFLEEPSVAWLGPGRALAVNVAPGGRILRYTDGVLSTEPPPPGLGRATAVAWIPAFGVVLGGEDGRIARLDDDGEWQVTNTALGASVRDLATFGDGLLAAGLRSGRTYMTQVHPFAQGCERDAFTPGIEVRLVALLDDALLVLSATADGRRAPMTLLSPANEIPECLRLR